MTKASNSVSPRHCIVSRHLYSAFHSKAKQRCSTWHEPDCSCKWRAVFQNQSIRIEWMGFESRPFNGRCAQRDLKMWSRLDNTSVWLGWMVSNRIYWIHLCHHNIQKTSVDMVCSCEVFIEMGLKVDEPCSRCHAQWNDLLLRSLGWHSKT